jgi:hypothetical protein
MVVMARQQLTLLDTPPSWRLDEATKATGRKGLAEARAALQAAIAAQHQVEPRPGHQRRTAA